MECNSELNEGQDADGKGTEIDNKQGSLSSYDRSQLPNLLRVYYTWLFPYDKYFEWLQYGKLASC